MSIKIEKRGKYPGVKVHLDPEECEAFIKLGQDTTIPVNPVPGSLTFAHPQDEINYFTVALKIGKKLVKISKDEPDFLKERTPEEIEAALMRDKMKIEAQLAAGVSDGKWKQVD